MNGRYHYDEAERLVEAANDALKNPGHRTLEEVTVDAQLFYAEAQIHATLAVAAAAIAQRNWAHWAGGE